MTQTHQNRAKMDRIEAYLMNADPVLKRVIDKVKLEQVESTDNVFHDLLSCVIEQQIHYRSSKKLFETLVSKSGLVEITPANFDQFEKFGLDEIKLSMRKIETLHEVKVYFESNPELNWNQMEDLEVRDRLGAIKGIGVWSIDMILLYTLNKDDIFPAGDYHLKKVMSALYGSRAEDKKSMLSVASNWKPFSSLATRYLLEFKNQKLI